MTLEGKVVQCLARQNLPDGSLGVCVTSPKQRPDIRIRLEYRLCPKPFPIDFAHVIARQPSIGAHEPTDEIVDKYMSRRWPKCIKATAEIASSTGDLRSQDVLRNILLYLRLHLWTRKNRKQFEKSLGYIGDQLSTMEGYRREYFHRQLYDMEGNRRPSSSRRFVPTDKQEWVGPGVAFLPNIGALVGVDELVWSAIIPSRNRTGYLDDLPAIERKLLDIRKHFNSYRELEDARRLLSQGETTASIRAAASSVDAILRFYWK